MTTEKRKSHHPLEGGSRISAYTFDTDELTIITDPKDPLYDRRVEDPLTREFLLSIAAKGVETPIAVRRRGAQSIVVRGKQRTKGVHVINAIGAGVPYIGGIKSIHVAINSLSADETFVKQVALFTRGKPIKIRALPANAGDERDARLSMRIENAHRHGDLLAERIRYVHDEIERFGTSYEDLALAEGVTVATIKRWQKHDSNSPRTKSSRRGKLTRPSPKQITALSERVQAHLTPRERALLDWVQGRSNGVDVAELFLETPVKSEAGTVRAENA